MAKLKLSAYQKRKMLDVLPHYVSNYKKDSGYTVGIDTSLTGVGVGVLDEEGKYVDAVLVETATTDGTVLQRLKMVQDGVADVLEEYEPDIISWESIRNPRNVNSFKKNSMALSAIAMSDYFCKNFDDILLIRYGAGQIKKAVSGAGGEKQLVMKNLLRKWQIDVDDDNKADATIVGKLGYFSKVFADRYVDYIEGNDSKRYQLMMDICKRRKENFEERMSDIDDDVLSVVMSRFQGKSALDVYKINDYHLYKNKRTFIKNYEKES